MAYENEDNPMPEGGESEDEGAETALVPKSALAGKDCKPGDMITMKVVHVYDDEYEVEYVKKDHQEKPEGETPMDAAEADLEGMAAMEA